MRHSGVPFRKHVGRKKQPAVGLAIRNQPPAPDESSLPHLRHPHHRGEPRPVRGIYFYPRARDMALVFFLVGWTLQFIGHAFERKAPEFFHDWRFLFVGLRWWTAKMRDKA